MEEKQSASAETISVLISTFRNLIRDETSTRLEDEATDSRIGFLSSDCAAPTPSSAFLAEITGRPTLCGWTRREGQKFITLMGEEKWNA